MPLSLTTAAAPANEARPWARGQRIAFVLVAICVGVLLRAQALSLPFASDDFIQLAFLEGTAPIERAPWNLYDFFRPIESELEAQRAGGTLPWWSSNHVHGAVLRPLTSLTLYLDWLLWPGDPAGGHAQSMLWWALMVAALATLAFELFPSRMAAMLVALVVLDHGTGLNVAWVANRAPLVCASFGFAALVAQQRSLAREGPSCSPAMLVLLAASLLGGEYGLSVLAFVFALDFERRDGEWKRRVLDALAACRAAIALGAAYVLVHWAAGYGSSDESFYISPFSHPLDFVAAALERWPQLAAELLWSLPAASFEWGERAPFAAFDAAVWEPLAREPWAQGGVLSTVHAVIASLLVGLFVVLWWRLSARHAEGEGHRRAQTLFLGTALALFPLVVAQPNARLLTVPQLGAAAALASFVHLSIRAMREGRSAYVLALLWLLPIQLVGDPIYLHRILGQSAQMWGASERSFERIAERYSDAQSDAGRGVLVLTTLDTSVVLGGQAVGLKAAKTPPAWSVLSMSSSPLVVQRVDARTLIVNVVGKPMLSSELEAFYRPDAKPLQRGERIRTPLMTVEIVATRAVENGAVGVSTLRLHFERDIDSGVDVYRSDAQSGELLPVEIPASPQLLKVPSPRP